ncbi:hypothetical protein [Mesotoga sp.]|uniref:hypothetical protein n=1 Tax=Mesotoga sp. TaxID=2053577 RepID=UPI0034578BE0
MSYWDKEKKQPRNKRVCIGKIDPETGEFIPSKRLNPEQAAVRDPAVTATAKIVGPAMVLDAVSKELGLEKVLKGCFSKLYRNDYLCYDITSVSSYGELNEYVKYGYNRDREKLKQINLALLVGQQSQLPAYYHSLPGNIFDDLKNQLDMKRLRIHSAASMDGRLFVQFIALILMSALRKKMRDTKLIEKYTVRELLLEMETLTLVRYSGKYGHILTEITKPQREILQSLKIQPKS